MHAEAQLNPQFLARRHGNRQDDMTPSRTPPSRREDPHENLRSPLGSCNARTQLSWQNQAQCADPKRRKKLCDAAAGNAAGGLRRAVPRRPSGAATAQPRTADRRAALLRPKAEGRPPNANRPAGDIALRVLRRDMRAARHAADRHRGRAVGRPRLPWRASARTPRTQRGTAPERAKRKAPSASATPCPPAASRCSTLGEGGLNCRVRDGTG